MYLFNSDIFEIPKALYLSGFLMSSGEDRPQNVGAQIKDEIKIIGSLQTFSILWGSFLKNPNIQRTFKD